jgi:hypothetical protein
MTYPNLTNSSGIEYYARLHDTFRVNITVDSPDIAIWSWQVGVYFNNTVLECTGLGNGNFFGGKYTLGFQSGTINNDSGNVTISGDSLRLPETIGVAGSGTLMWFQFHVKERGSSILNLTLSPPDLTVGTKLNQKVDSSIEPVSPIDLYDGKIAIVRLGDLGSGPPPTFFACDESVDAFDYALWKACYDGLGSTGSLVSISSSVGSGAIIGTNDAPERRCFFEPVTQLFWIFWASTSDIYLNTSSDGITWSAGTVVRARSTYFGFSVVLNYHSGNPYIHYAFVNETVGNATHLSGDIRYRRGLLQSAGTISWSADEQIAVAGRYSWSYLGVDIAVDSSFRPWITYNSDDTGTTENDANVTMSTMGDGTWVTGSGFPYKSSTSQSCVRPRLAPLSGNRVLLLYINSTESSAECLHARLYNGTGWDSEAVIAADAFYRDMYSITYKGDNVYVAYLNYTNYYIQFLTYTYGSGWSTITTVNASSYNHYPLLSIDNDTSTIYCFWTNSTTVFYKTKPLGGSWDDTPTTWFSDSEFISRFTTSSISYSNEISFLYSSISPSKIKHHWLILKT